jgi:translation initiation factor 1
LDDCAGARRRALSRARESHGHVRERESARLVHRRARRLTDALDFVYFTSLAQGLNPKINKKIILKECKKRFNCNGCIIEDPEHGDIVQLQGDQRKLVAQFLIDEKISKKTLIKVHGS